VTESAHKILALMVLLLPGALIFDWTQRRRDPTERRAGSSVDVGERDRRHES
jgi:hypothetical protein